MRRKTVVTEQKLKTTAEVFLQRFDEQILKMKNQQVKIIALKMTSKQFELLLQ